MTTPQQPRTPTTEANVLDVRGFASPGVDDPLRDFMATYFDHDDDATRGMVIDYLDRIGAALIRHVRADLLAQIEKAVRDQGLGNAVIEVIRLAVIRAAAPVEPTDG